MCELMVPNFNSLLIVSPHLDDAVFSCGDLLACHPGIYVSTVFTAVAQDPQLSTEWDLRCGFFSAEGAMQARIAEDERALNGLQAHALRMNFTDRQYGASPPLATLVTALEVLIRQHPDTAIVAVPFGLCHPDHDLVHQACVQLIKRHPEKDWLGYEEAPYRNQPGLVQQRLIALHQQGLAATPFALNLDCAASPLDIDGLRLRAIACYASQLQGFDADDIAEIHAPGRYWRLIDQVPTEVRQKNLHYIGSI
jgi:LmbE family N-acetylglucosaminyl deacetylase